MRDFILLLVVMWLPAAGFAQSGTTGETPVDGQVYLPTEVYRESIDGSRQKIEYAYDEFGHIVSEKWSYDQNGTYVTNREITRKYHRMPNGEFVLMMEEGDMDWMGNTKVRHSIAYDDRGMELWNRYESYESGEWKVVYRASEAVLNENGVRTAIRTFNVETGEMEIDPNYTFDDRGRTTQATDYGTYTYTWNDNDRLTGFSSSEEGTFHNMEIIINEEYFNPYALDPLLDRNKSVEDDYVWNDYTLHEWLFSADGDRMTVRATEDKAKGEATQTIFVGDVEMMKMVYKKGDNGSYSITTTRPSDRGTYKNERGRIYDKYGAVTREYDMEYDTGDDFILENVTVYKRTYDAAGRPVQTAKVNDGETWYTETYVSWRAVTPLGTEVLPAVLPVVKVYPNPAVDVIVIDGAPIGSTLAVFDVSGRIIYRRENIDGRETVPVASWSGGLYFVSVQTPEGPVTHKIIKK
ncbi:MAG: T9SS type A sorting domain-containing protein [Tannerella sp.]|jgi:YD repeat-containing protein|nr:T9SS type A sorting domain-containing protein [Tannerella sp.]